MNGQNIIWNRPAGRFETENEYGDAALNFLYNNRLGQFLLRNVVIKPTASKLFSLYERSRWSRRQISPFIEKHGIDMSPFKQASEYRCFDDFFTRKKSIEISKAATDLVSVADARLSAYIISDDLKLMVKHGLYALEDIMEGPISESYSGGTCLLFRLAPSDYHRFIFFDDGFVLDEKDIPGVLHTVRDVSAGHNIYCKNSRHITRIVTQHCGEVIYLEVGALCVGRITQTHSNGNHLRGEEKGFFSYGGSSIVLLFERNRIEVSEDIAECSEKGIEAKVCAGETIGRIVQRE